VTGPSLQRLTAVDSHTAGEPTRVVIDGGPDLGNGPLAQRVDLFRRRHDRYRSAIVNEPRGSDVIVGALLVPPHDSSCDAGVIFFNNVGYLGMCGHGLIGLMVTLSHVGRVGPGPRRIETPVGVVTATLGQEGEVSVANVASRRLASGVTVDVPHLGTVRGDVAWGGNWFFLVHEHSLTLQLSEVERLTEHAWRMRQAVNRAGFPQVDHVELIGAATRPHAHARNFVLCPGKVYDRSPCGTGTSAQLACLAADGKLDEGDDWIQEGILGSTFTGRFRWQGDQILPTITGRAYVTAELRLCIDQRDPFGWGIRA
jgi:4-hydroxyproline epimerase